MPYRSSVEKIEPPAEPLDEASVLGALRSTHAAVTLWRRLLPEIGVVVVLVLVAIVLAPSFGGIVFAVMLPTAILAFALLAWSPIRARKLRVALHTHGVVVTSSTKRDVIAFEDVDEVWFSMDSFGPLGVIAMIRAMDLVGHDGVKHRVPLNVENGTNIGQWILRQCSEPLVADSLRALRNGDTLTFGKLELDRMGIRSRRWTVQWSELRLVRFSSGRIHLFRHQTIFPWRTIRLDQMPHPTIFNKLVAESAQKIDVYDPAGLASK